MNHQNWPRFSILVCSAVIALWGGQIQAQPKPALSSEPVDVLPAPTISPGFGIPEGLRTPADQLLSCLGFGPASCFPLTPDSCYDVAYKCLCARQDEDALAFVNHGLKMCNHARLYLMKAICELELGRCDDAISTLAKYRHAAVRPEESVGLYSARQRLNGPARVRLEILLKGWRDTNTSP